MSDFSGDGETECHSYFNIESSEDTAELESALRNEAIGGTLYDKREVLQAVFEMTQSKSPDSKSLQILSDMTLEPDVCDFFMDSGCLSVIAQIVFKDISNETIVSSGTSIIKNTFCNGNLQPTKALIGDANSSHSLLVLMIHVIMEINSSDVLENAFKVLQIFCEMPLEESDICGGNIIETLTGDDIASPFFSKISFMLQASRNTTLLGTIANFLLDFIHLSREHEKDLKDFLGNDSIDNVAVAFKEAVDDPKASFYLIEVLGSLLDSQDDHNACQFDDKQSADLCEIISHYLEYNSYPASSFLHLVTPAKVLSRCWRIVRHERSFQTISMLVTKMKEQSVVADDPSSLAAAANVEKCLRRFQECHREGKSLPKR